MSLNGLPESALSMIKDFGGLAVAEKPTTAEDSLAGLKRAIASKKAPFPNEVDESDPTAEYLRPIIEAAKAKKATDEIERLIAKAVELKMQGNAFFAQGNAPAASGNKKDHFYAAKASYTKIRLWLDSLDLPNVLDSTAMDDVSKPAPVPNEKLEQIRAIRYHGDINSAICSYKLATLLPLADTAGRRRELERALDFANRAATKPKNVVSAANDVKRDKAVFWRGRLRSILGDIDGAAQDLAASLEAYRGSDGEAAVQKEIKNLALQQSAVRAKEKQLYGGWLNTK